MTLADLFDAVRATGALTRGKDRKSSLLHLAKALGHASLEACPVDAALAKEDTWRQKLDTYFAAIIAGGKKLSAHTMGETRTNIRAVFHLAEAHALLAAPLPPTLLTRPKREDYWRQRRAMSPVYARFHPQNSPRHYGLSQAQWPEEIQHGWQHFLAQRVKNLRPATHRNYVCFLELYFGYLSSSCADPIRWADVVDVEKLRSFVRWHAERFGCTDAITEGGKAVMDTAISIATTLEDPAEGAMRALRRRLRKTPPVPLHIKRNHTVPLETLEAIGNAYLADGRLSFQSRGRRVRYPGAQRATRFGKGLILKFLRRLPIRIRNVVEMQYGKHLKRDPATGHLWLEYRGEDLKVARRHKDVNEYRVDLTAEYPELVTLFEEWQATYRRRLPNSQDGESPYVFLTQDGNPHTTRGLWQELSTAVHMHTGTYWHPHAVRHSYATEYLESEGADFTTAAVMLGDTVQSVLRSYQVPDPALHHGRGSAWTHKQRRTG
jgi:hypothetical protein